MSIFVQRPDIRKHEKNKHSHFFFVVFWDRNKVENPIGGLSLLPLGEKCRLARARAGFFVHACAPSNVFLDFA